MILMQSLRRSMPLSETWTRNAFQQINYNPFVKDYGWLQCMHLACDISWDEMALISQFRFGLLHSDVKVLLLTSPDPTTLNQAITQAIWCDN